MKVALGSKIIDGPWGGGNLFIKNLKNYLLKNNIKVTHSILEPDIDIILLTEPRIESESSSISLFEARLYRALINKKVKLIHRINECDERKNTNFVNRQMLRISEKSDYTIYVSSWIMEIFLNKGLTKKNSKVIKSGSDKNIFNTNNKKIWEEKNKLKIVTHHWGANWNKGFEIYNHLDNLLTTSPFKNLIEFTYIGNLPKNYKFKNSNYLEPMYGKVLADELKKHDLYITGSINEPSGNHQIEGALCGLPVLYLDSGGIKEYQKDFGIEYELSNLEEKIYDIRNNYKYYYEKNKFFPYTSDLMCKEYVDTFNFLYKLNIHKESYVLLNFYKFLYSIRLIPLLKSLLAKIIYQIRKVNL